MKKLIILMIFLTSSLIFSQAYRTNYASKLFLSSDPQLGGYEIIAPPNLSTTYTFSLPPTLGNDGEILMSLGDGSYTWTDPTISTVSPGGNNTNIQFSNSQSFSGSDLLTWNNSSNRMFIGTNLGSSNVNVKNWVASGNDSKAGFLSLHTGNTTFRTNFSANPIMTESVTFTLPPTDGTAGQFLVTDGNGNLGWTSASVGGSGATFNCESGQGTGGGTGNTALEDDTFIGGGTGNTIPGDGSISSVIGGGSNNIITSGSEYSGIVAGSSNTLTQSKKSVIGAGSNNIINGADEAGIGAGKYNRIDDIIDTSNDSDRSIIGSGEYNYISSSEGAILSGYSNTISADNKKYNFIGSGQNNFISNTSESGITTGNGNIISKQYSFIGGGSNNNVSGDYSSIAGGANNTLSGNYSTILGGSSNTVSGQYSMAFGLQSKATADYAVAIGRNANAIHSGAFVLADGNSESVSSTTTNQLTMRFTGGYVFYTSTGTAGMAFAPGANSWAAASDKNLKSNILKIDYSEILNKISDLSISTWSYIFADKKVRNYGPMAQDFFRLFGNDNLGEFGSDKEIISNHITNVGIAALKGLTLEYEITNKKIKDLKNEQNQILEELILLETEINKIQNKIGDIK